MELPSGYSVEYADDGKRVLLLVGGRVVAVVRNGNGWHWTDRRGGLMSGNFGGLEEALGDAVGWVRKWGAPEPLPDETRHQRA